MPAHKLTMPRSGDVVRTTRKTRYVLACQYGGEAPRIVQGSSSYEKLRTALDRRLRQPYTYTLSHVRPDYVIFDLADDGRVVAESKGDDPPVVGYDPPTGPRDWS